MESPTLQMHHFEARSRSNGPGLRAVLWFQGCTLNCPGCFNPATHSPSGGDALALEHILRQIRALEPEIEGITISGGEPFQQPCQLAELLTQVKASTHLSVVLFSGFTLEEIQRLPAGSRALKYVDVLIAGRYRQDLRLARGLVGSANKTIHCLTDRYSPADFLDIPEAEVIIAPDGGITLSGIDPLKLTNA